MTTKFDPKGRSFSPGSRVPRTPAERARTGLPPLDVTETLRGKRLLLIGGTGFLGKVLVGMLLQRFPEIAHIYLMVRPKGKMSPRERFEEEVWATPCFDPLRDEYPFEKLYTKLTPIPGDVVEKLAGIPADILEELRRVRVDVVMNVAGVVSFDPPLDEGLRVNAVGVQNLLDLCRALALPPAQPNVSGAPTDAPMPAPPPDKDAVDKANAVPLLHTSTCYVAGFRTGTVWEDDPRLVPFPKASPPMHESEGGLDRAHWDPLRELDEGMAIARHLRARAVDAQMESRFLDRARAKLRETHRPTTGEPLAQAIKKEREKFIDDELGKAGMERAKHWGWPNTYTYTKSIGEQLLAGSGQPYTIVRPAVVESSIEFPFRGWNEGINTTAPLIYLAMSGQIQFPTRPGSILDVIPVDMVCAGTILSCASLMRGEQADVYQYGSADTNPLTLHRMIELTSLFKRRFMRSRNRGNPLVNRLLAHNGLMPVTPEVYSVRSTPMHKRAFDSVSSGLALLKKTPASGVARAGQRTIAGLTKSMAMTDFIFQTFLPFMAELNYSFRCDNTRSEAARLVEADRTKLMWAPHEIDWRDYWNEVHVKGLRKWVFPHLEAKLMKRPRAEDRFSDLLSLLDEVAEREGNHIALQRIVTRPDGSEELEGVSYRDLRRRALACASRLADIGVHPGARIALVAKNSPEWAIAFFGILATGASVIPLDPKLDGVELGRRMAQTGASIVIVADGVEAPVNAACLDLAELTETPAVDVDPPEVLVRADDVAVIAYTAGTTGAHKPVVLTHKNMTAVLASVAPLFKITSRDSGLSVLPLFHTFELTCGLLLPMLRGARVTYVDDVTTESLADAFQVAGITAMIGVPQVWEELEEKLQRELQDSGPFAEAAFQAGLFVNRTLGKALGINLGRVLFRPIHDRLGGKVRFLVSTGGPVPKKTADTFRALGIELKQGYGLTEAAPVLALGDAKGGRPIPGVEVELRDKTEDGVGEIVARGDAIMQGYLDEELTARTLADDGWLRTGDLGRIDKDGRITVVARQGEVITLASGRRVYPRNIEEALGKSKGVDEICVVGVPDGQGGERLACLVVAKASDKDGADLALVEKNVAWTARKLEEHERPSLVVATRRELPRTSDRKVKRTEVIAAIVAHDAKGVRTMRSGEGAPVEPNEILDARDVPALATEDRLVAPSRRNGARPVARKAGERKEDEPIDIPAPVRDVVKGALGGLQRLFYDRGLSVEVEGEEHIPWDRQTIVVANHASHLDMGLIKTALGSYGTDIVALAAKDYFFEGKWRRTYFEKLTNLRPLDRGDNPREAMREASSLLERGHTVLLFPEGTRTSTGDMTAFRPAVAWLALKHGVDVLPVYCEGTYRSMPRGSFVPRNRNVAVRIGEVIPASSLQAASDAAGLRLSAACQKVTLVVQRAVEALRDRRGFDLDRALAEHVSGVSVAKKALGNGNGAANGNGHQAASEESETGRALREIFADLEKRFQKDAVKEKATFYFSLGDGKDAKWTVVVSKEGCKIVNDKVEGKADCVFKTDVKMFTKIMKEHYIPDVSEFMNGTVKTNDPELLTTFLQLFNL